MKQRELFSVKNTACRDGAEKAWKQKLILKHNKYYLIQKGMEEKRDKKSALYIWFTYTIKRLEQIFHCINKTNLNIIASDQLLDCYVQ